MRLLSFAPWLLISVLAGCGSDDPKTVAETTVEPGPVVVDTPSGQIEGWREASGQAFLGIPYAQPPTGALRWAAPEPAAAWSDVRNTLAEGSPCPQEIPIAGPRGAEDCLTLNVHTPEPRPERAPVMVWFHGGGFILGQGMQTDGGTAGDRIAEATGSVVVSVNYRLGALGFLAHPSLTKDGSSGNYGLLDQVEALRWVKVHIPSFGGDPARVTIFGQSAGSISVCHHMLSPLSKGLFQQAIMQSGACTLPTPSLAAAEVQGEAFATALGCEGDDAAACLRTASLDDVRATLPPDPAFISTDPSYGFWMPIIDGEMIPRPPQQAIDDGTLADVPTLIGWTQDEGSLFVLLSYEQQGIAVTADNYEQLIADNLADADLAAQVAERYPLRDFKSPGAALAEALGDALFVCPGRTLMHDLSAANTTYGYQFDYQGADFQLPTEVELGAYHSSETQFLFGYPATLFVDDFEADQKQLWQSMMGYWGQFAKTGDPNGNGTNPAWPAHDASADEQLRIDLEPTADSSIKKEICSFWAGLDYLPSPL